MSHSGMGTQSGNTSEGGRKDEAEMANPRVRRKLQNRLNQRISRERKLRREEQAGIQRRSRGRPRTDVQPVNRRVSSMSRSQGTSRCADSETGIELVGLPPGTSSLFQPALVCFLDSAQTMAVMDRLAYAVNCSLLQGNPTSDLLLSVTQLNSYRAIKYNMDALNLNLEIIKDQNAISYFNAPAAAFNTNSVPPSLHPTSLQKSQVHHPYIDPLPIPSLRDALLHNEGLYNDYDFCRDMIGDVGKAGIMVWGDPWDPYGLEVSESFANKWLWLLRSCHEMLVSTNYWRAQRGEADLFSL
ncbi:hypothetical protein N5P37_004505 [Trichoderma harzianum]|uniref:BZIP domain-containing protein n=1 Tax=Trichoderma harzianum CBS 226.95 TaxID=983964 RepID=A0A2T3ZS64_TRIHA|nr:hypothetical protein M431DRAFT_21866 [Trichoderma harzianum CBS 226.95]KAK0762979.1 hypothetical protein N5P37_004505 [Trichoderma harzianum]PKK50838.1 hypothetical protein CI102_4471 [Trichoderma harzianum]PTB47657.1 hypothetical protein M431DRAFT_21866 [Trichoderma harzianum CBS 226.95]